MRLGKIHIELDVERENYIRNRIIDSNNEVIEQLEKEHKQELDKQIQAYEKVLESSNKTNMKLITDKENIEYQLKIANEKIDMTMTNLDSVSKELLEANKVIQEQKKQLNTKEIQINSIVKINNALGQTLRKDIAIKKQMINALREKSIKVWKLVDLVKLIG